MVLSGGVLWDPRFIVSEHGVEGCDHGPHDGDDGEFFGLAAGDEGEVAGFEGVVVGADDADGAPVEDAAELAATTLGNALIFLETAVLGASAVC